MTSTHSVRVACPKCGDVSEIDVTIYSKNEWVIEDEIVCEAGCHLSAAQKSDMHNWAMWKTAQDEDDYRRYGRDDG